MPRHMPWNSRKKKENKQRVERQMENEERQERRTGSQTLHEPKWYSTGDINRQPRRFNSMPSINGDALDYRMLHDLLGYQLQKDTSNSKSQERFDLIEQRQDYTNSLVQNLCRSVESLLQMADDDLFYKSDYDDCDDDLISEAPHKYVVRKSLLDLKDNLDTKYIVDELYARHAIDGDELQSVQGQKTDARKTRRLAIILERKPPSTFEAFLGVLNGDEQLDWLHEELKRKYEVAKRSAKTKCCQFCYVCNSTDVRNLADHMYSNRSLNLMEYKYLVNDAVSETERWQSLRQKTPEMSEARDGFINALQDLYPEVEKKIRFGFTIDNGKFQCTCSDRHRRTSKKYEPRTIKKRPGAKIARDIGPYVKEDDQFTIERFLSEENVSISGSGLDAVPDIVATNRPKEMELSELTAANSPKPSPIVEASPIIRRTSEEVLGTSELKDDKIDETGAKALDTQKENVTSDIGKTENIQRETTDGDGYKYLSFVLGLVVLLLLLVVMTPNDAVALLAVAPLAVALLAVALLAVALLAVALLAVAPLAVALLAVALLAVALLAVAPLVVALLAVALLAVALLSVALLSVAPLAVAPLAVALLAVALLALALLAVALLALLDL
ncbi:hypothetical protein LOTGIDRAFT_233360 [Lottia gigantea]|uniref:CARD domain-containing protein n=1 Tax=Lottia gigantea TaxID=225164 RepID=V4BRM0_LOTGI|nr:hypothetical protein LOTGIDRAFT_233360 [Lottia gigantea]ESO91544.1 hypothetical protein LOTGIDRAFT_233360 [Lottia gigantea]